MARLNEPPVAPGPSADSVEAGELELPENRVHDWRYTADMHRPTVKRRFLRQNRELAKYIDLF